MFKLCFRLFFRPFLIIVLLYDRHSELCYLVSSSTFPKLGVIMRNALYTNASLPNPLTPAKDDCLSFSSRPFPSLLKLFWIRAWKDVAYYSIQFISALTLPYQVLIHCSSSWEWSKSLLPTNSESSQGELKTFHYLMIISGWYHK